MAGYGMHGDVQINMQNSFGTSQTNSLEAIPIVSESVELQISQITQNNMYGRFAESPTLQGAQTIQGDVSIEAEPQALGWFLNAYCGADSTTAHVHAFQPARSDFDDKSAVKPFTLKIFRDVGSAFLYYDLLATTLELSVANGELLNSSIGVIGAGFSRTAGTSPTYPVGQTLFKWDQSSITYNGTAAVDFRDVTISLNKNLQAIWTLQESTSPSKIKRSAFESVEISGTLLYQNAVDGSLFTDFQNQTERKVTLNFLSNSPNNLFVDIPSFKFTSLTPVMDNADIIEASFTARAEFNVGSNTQIEFLLTNVRTINY